MKSTAYSGCNSILNRFGGQIEKITGFDVHALVFPNGPGSGMNGTCSSRAKTPVNRTSWPKLTQCNGSAAQPLPNPNCPIFTTGQSCSLLFPMLTHSFVLLIP